jgi:hypothetical protein
MYHPFALKLLAHVSQEVNKKDGVQETTIEIKDATRLHVREKNPHEELRSITFDELVMSIIYMHTSFSLCMHITHGMCSWLFTYELSFQCHNKLKYMRLLLNG